MIESKTYMYYMQLSKQPVWCVHEISMFICRDLFSPQIQVLFRFCWYRDMQGYVS